MRRQETEALAVPAKDIAELGVANANCILEHSVEDRSKIARRA